MTPHRLSELFSDAVVVSELDPEQVSIQAEEPRLFPDEQEAVARAVPVRKRQFIAGRVCARMAIARFGLPATCIGVGPHREPLFPPEVVGSITHTRDWCAAAVALRSDRSSLGLDVEPASELPREIWSKVLTPDEQAWLPIQSDVSAGLMATLVFSAKEAFYKCQFGVTRSWLGFQDVTVRPDVGSGSFELRLLRDAAPLEPGSTWTGRCFVGDVFVGTALELTTSLRSPA